MYHRLFALLYNLCRRLRKGKRGRAVFLAPNTETANLLPMKQAWSDRGGNGVLIMVRGGLRTRLRLFTIGIWHLAGAGVIFLNDTFTPLAWMDTAGRQVIQLWHAEGALKKFGLSLPLLPERARNLREQSGKYTAVAVSAENVRAAYAEAFGVDVSIVLPLGSPRTDALLQPLEPLFKPICPHKWYFAAAPEKPWVLYAPTFRENGDDPVAHFDFEAFRARFGDTAELLVRTHPHMTAGKVPYLPPWVHDASSLNGPDIRHLAVLITDYSSICMDAVLLGVPVICYTYDYAAYTQERGFYTDLRMLPPGAVCDTFAEVMDCVAAVLAGECLPAGEAFCAHHLSACDGGAVGRILSLL
ncbi:MAG: CDP-glycerol glycerophosphotransferase family protein [Oscillospiraceae bacterium]|jgi:CDP-glycerol glycerophosphotransferase (TagB/SpsB family)|nr:CDP-glycerol glycerophosphotransferase family protein [Oscillospiraceae bacterium]